MSWDIEFVGSLNRSSLYVRYRLEFVGVLNALGEPFSVSDDQGPVQIARGSVRITGSRVIPQRWSVSFGGFSLQLSGDIRSILPKMRRGQIAVLQCSINRGGFRNLAIGSLDTISGQRGLFSLGFKDLLSALQMSMQPSLVKLYINLRLRYHSNVFLLHQMGQFFLLHQLLPILKLLF